MPSATLPDLTGRIAIVTGANKGIGLWTAVGLAKAGADVALVCRDKVKGEEALAFIAKHADKPARALFLADFADLKAVDALGRQLAETYPRVHILVNNAGLISPRYELSRDGYEMTFAVNHLAPFLLTQRLLPSLKAAGAEGPKKARIVTVSSIASRRASIKFSNLMYEGRYSVLGAYSQSKLANILFTKELARRLEREPVTANCLHPGIVATAIGNKGVLSNVLWSLVKLFAIGEEQGARNSLYVASAPELEGVSGVFFVKEKPFEPNPIANDPKAVEKLWDDSERLVTAALRS